MSGRLFDGMSSKRLASIGINLRCDCSVEGNDEFVVKYCGPADVDSLLWSEESKWIESSKAKVLHEPKLWLSGAREVM